MRIMGAVAMISFLALSAPAATWHVSPAGSDTNSGSEKAPFATLKRAVEAATTSAEPGEIVLHAGVYPGDVTIPAPASAPSNPPPLLIRAASREAGGFEDVVIDGGRTITEAKLVDAARGIYFVPVALANFEPSMWEADKRLRYPFLADRRSVEVFPGSLAPGRDLDGGDLKEGLYFRTSDSRPPAEHDLGLARDRKGLIVLRPNVTVRGLRFRHFQLYFGVCAVSIEAANVTVERCEVWNAWGAFMVSEGIPDAKILACTATDVATGVKSYGRNTVVEDCRFIRINDAFEVQEYEQDQCGIQFYSSHTQTARRNLCAGFNLGIFIKASGGVLILEDNTVVAPPKGGERGIGPNTWRPGSVCRGNLVTGYEEPISVSTLNRECRVTSNQIWLASSPKRAEETAAAIKADAGGETAVARPLFVNEAKGDYRLAATVAGKEADTSPPMVKVEVQAPAQLCGLRSQVYSRKNSWIGGKEPELIEDTVLDPARAAWLVPTNRLTLRLKAEDALGTVKALRVRRNAADWSAPEPFRETLVIDLPGEAAWTDIAVQVSDAAGNWSEPAKVRVMTAARPPRLVGKPTIITSGQGAIIAFKTDIPCQALIEWGSQGAFDWRVEDPVETRFRNDVSQGMEYTELISGPRTGHCLALIPPAKAGPACSFRLKLKGIGTGEAALAEEGVFTLQGPARTLHVAAAGNDGENGGSKESPFATIQYAVDRALPGDRVLVAPGVYAGSVSVTHGGVAGNPIRIESAVPRAAVLDGRRDEDCGFRLSNVSHVQISGFEIRWYAGYGVLMYRAGDILVEHCTCWGRHWVKGRPGPSEGIGAYKSARIAVDHSVFFALNSAFRFSECEGLRLTGNTASRCFHRVLEIAYSAPCYLRDNSFAFGSSYVLALTLTPAQVAAVDSDYNNFAVQLREDAYAYARKENIVIPPGEMLKREEGFFMGESKSLASLGCHKPDYTFDGVVNIPTLTPWREKTGQDKHSIVAHPRYADPQNRDFRLLPASPNIGAGENGGMIGALGVAAP